MEKFRFHRGINVGYRKQGYIFFLGMRYRELPPEKQERLREHCRACGGEHDRALFELVTSGDSMVAVCARHYISSRTTLDRALKRYYEEFPKDL